MKSIFAKSLVICAAVAAVAPQLLAQTTTAPAGAWPQFRGANRDGKSPDKGLLTSWPEGGPKLLWSVDSVGKGFSHVSVAGDLVYVTGLIEKDGVLRAYTLDGKLKWDKSYGPEHSTDHAGARTTPTVHDGLVYVVSTSGKLSCFKAADGEPVWSVDTFEKYQAKPIKWGYSESVLIDGDNVFATPGGAKATMVALDRKTGKEVWASKPGHGANYVSPLLVEHGKVRMVVTVTDKAVVAFAAADGKTLWEHPYANFRKNHANTPIYQDGVLYITSGYGKGAIALKLADDGASVKQAWEQPKQDPVHGQAVLVDGCVYASSHETLKGKWTCLDFKTGDLKWQAAGVGRGGSIIYADGLFYCYSEDGNVGIMKPSPDKCEVVSSFKVPMGDGSQWAHPVVANGKLFIRRGNALMCYDISAKSGNAATPATRPAQ